MIVRRTVHGLSNNFTVTTRTIVREGNRNVSLITEILGMRSFYQELAIEHFVCPDHDNGLDSKPCATVEVV